MRTYSEEEVFEDARENGSVVYKSEYKERGNAWKMERIKGCIEKIKEDPTRELDDELKLFKELHPHLFNMITSEKKDNLMAVEKLIENFSRIRNKEISKEEFMRKMARGEL